MPAVASIRIQEAHRRCRVLRWTDRGTPIVPVAIAPPKEQVMAKQEEGTTLSAQEKAALKERTRELKAAKKGAEAEQAVLDAIAALSDDERPLAERVHELIKQAAPELAAR